MKIVNKVLPVGMAMLLALTLSSCTPTVEPPVEPDSKNSDPTTEEPNDGLTGEQQEALAKAPEELKQFLITGKTEVINETEFELTNKFDSYSFFHWEDEENVTQGSPGDAGGGMANPETYELTVTLTSLTINGETMDVNNLESLDSSLFEFEYNSDKYKDSKFPPEIVLKNPIQMTFEYNLFNHATGRTTFDSTKTSEETLIGANVRTKASSPSKEIAFEWKFKEE